MEGGIESVREVDVRYVGGGVVEVCPLFDLRGELTDSLFLLFPFSSLL